MATNHEEPRRRRGRPSKAEEVRRVLAEVGCDPALVDPRRVLASIAGDADAPASARVSAARALLDNPAETKPGNGKAGPSKKARAQHAAANAGGASTPWGEDLDWGSNGHRPQ